MLGFFFSFERILTLFLVVHLLSTKEFYNNLRKNITQNYTAMTMKSSVLEGKKIPKRHLAVWVRKSRPWMTKLSAASVGCPTPLCLWLGDISTACPLQLQRASEDLLLEGSKGEGQETLRPSVMASEDSS